MAQVRLSALLWAFGGLVGTASAVCTRSILAFQGDTCATIASANGITVQQFVQWNGGLASCTLSPGRSYCVADNGSGQPATSSKPAGPTQAPGLVSSPDGTCGPGTNYLCDNPAFGLCCSEHGYCGDTQDHCGTGCNNKYGTCNGGSCPGVSTTTVFVTTTTSTCPPGQGGGSTKTITSTATITSTSTSTRTVTTAGPGVISTVTVIRSVTLVSSVTVTGTRTVTVTTTTTKDTQPAIPTWKGTIPTCRTFYQLQDGDTCVRIARQFGITNKELQYWNPQLDCTWPNDAIGYNICVGIPGTLLEDPN